MRQLLLTFILIGLLLVSCVEKSNDFPQPESKLVVFGFFSPEDDFITINVFRILSDQMPDKNNPYNAVRDAEVTITDEYGKHDFYYKNGLSKYFADTNYLKIEEGKTYRLDVRTPLNEHAWATCTISGKINPSLSFTAEVDSVCDYYMDLSTLEKNKICDYSRYDVQVKLKDLPGIQNYLLGGEIGYLSTYGQGEFFVTRGRLEFNRNEIWNEELQSDGSLLGPFYGSLDKDDMINGNRPVSTYEGRFLRLNLYTPDIEMAKYLKTLPDNLTIPGPFDEPVTLYSNINGGIGVFASYRKYSFVQKVY